MATETDQPVDIQQLVKDDIAKFLIEGRGRPAYAAAVFRKSESLVAAMKEIEAYLGAGKAGIITLEKMVDYAVDVYDQGIAFNILSHEDPIKEDNREEQLYQRIRTGITSFLKDYFPDLWEEKNWQGFIRLFTVILPRRLEPSDFRLAIWRLLYGEDTDEAGLPKKMPHHRKEVYIRQQLEKM